MITLLALIAAAGCQSSGKSRQALELYEKREYASALGEASAIAQNSTGIESERAALVAGMSAYELKKYDEARRWLRAAARSADRQVSGKASATLGLVGVAQEQHSLAAVDLTTAGRKLEGDEAARAHYLAGQCYTLLGRLDEARRSYNTALGLVRDPELRREIQAAGQDAAFTLQLGAFSNRANAERIAFAAQKRAAAAGLPPPAIISTPDVTGRTIHLVHIGRFDTRAAAVSARSKLGGDAVVVPVRSK